MRNNFTNPEMNISLFNCNGFGRNEPRRGAAGAYGQRRYGRKYHDDYIGQLRLHILIFAN